MNPLLIASALASIVCMLLVWTFAAKKMDQELKEQVIVVCAALAIASIVLLVIAASLPKLQTW